MPTWCAAMKNLGTTISNLLRNQKPISESSLGDGFLHTRLFRLGGRRPHIYIYQTIGMQVTSYLRGKGLSIVQYIDDRFAVCPRRTNFESDDKTQSHTQRDPLQMACLIVTELTTLGYTLAINKCQLVPTTVVRYLGFIVDSSKQAYLLPSDKKKTFIEIRETILKADAVDVKTLQRFAGKCVSMAIAIPGAKLYTREVNFAISQCTKNSRRAAISHELRQELEHWRFIDDWLG